MIVRLPSRATVGPVALPNRDDYSRAFCESGTRNVLKPAISGNHSAASREASVKTAAGTSPLISRSIAPASVARIVRFVGRPPVPIAVTRSAIPVASTTCC